MAKNKKPKYKIGEEIYFKTMMKMGEGTIREIYGSEDFCYMVETPIEKYDNLFQPIVEKDIYKKLA